MIGSNVSREKQLGRRAERAERRVAELEAKLQKAREEAEATRLAAAGAGTPKKGSGGAFFSPVTNASVTLEKLGALAQQCKIMGMEDDAHAAVGEFGATLVADAEKLMQTATSLERNVCSQFPRDGKIGRSRVVRELAEYVRGPEPFASRLLLGEFDATKLECLRVEAERAAAKENDDSDDESDDDSDDESDDDSDDGSDDDLARAPGIPAGCSATDTFGLTETQKRNLSLNPAALWKANPAQVEFLEARFAERLAAGEAEPSITREERVKQTLELAKLGPILEQKVASWWSNRRQKQKKLASRAGTQAAAAKKKPEKKKPVAPFFRFMRAQRESGRDDGMSVQDFTKSMGQEWRALSEAEKEAWKEDGDADGDDKRRGERVEEDEEP